jgi:hypothetical protein
MVSGSKAHGESITDGLLNLERNEAEKFSPRSIALPYREWSDSVRDYFHSDVRVPEVSAIARELRKVMKGNLRPISFDLALKSLDKTKQAAIPYMVAKGDVIPGYSLQQLRRDLEGPLFSVLAYRTEVRKKMRAVWMYSFAMAVLEQTFFQALLPVRKASPARAAIVSPAAVDKSVTDLFGIAQRTGKDLISIDFKGYDKTVKWKLQWRAWLYVASLFQNRYADDLALIIHHFASGGLVTPDGILVGAHGVPSGSTFTNEIDSIAQEIAINDNVSASSQSNAAVQGDDGLYVDSLDRILRAADDNGLTVSKEKSMVSKREAHYLQLYYHPSYVDSVGILTGIYPITRCACHILFPDRRSDKVIDEIGSDEYYACRTVQLLSNCIFHPLIKQFAKYVQEHSPYSLSLKWISQQTLDRYNLFASAKSSELTFNRGHAPLTKDSPILEVFQ